MSAEININQSIIRWAIERAGYELNEFAKKFPKVLDWLEDKKKPTLKQLEAFSHKAYVPFGYLFLQSPPEEHLPIPFFRTGKKQTDHVNLNIYDTILILQRRQEWLVEYLKESEFEQLPFVGKFRGKTSHAAIVADIRKTLELENEWASDFKKIEDALNFLTGKIEDAGIITVFNSVVENNNRRAIEVEDCRGFVLVNQIAPFMYVNAADSKGAQMFTIIHELAHIWTGHSAGFDFRRMLPADDPIEQLCDKVAAEFLVPENSFSRVWRERPEIQYVATHFKVSQIVIARRALDLNYITKSAFFDFYNNYIQALKTKKEKQPSGGDFYATQKKRISLRFASHVNTAVKENKLLYRDAYRLTGLKGDTYQNFFSKHLY